MTDDDLGAVVEAMYEDKKTVLRSQLAGIAVEIGERRRIMNAIKNGLDEEVLDLGSTIANLTRSESPDLYLKERVTLEEHRRSLTQEMRGEQLNAWRDVQELRREQRSIEQELVQAVQRTKRLEELAFHAPGPV